MFNLFRRSKNKSNNKNKATNSNSNFISNPAKCAKEQQESIVPDVLSSPSSVVANLEEANATNQKQFPQALSSLHAAAEGACASPTSTLASGDGYFPNRRIYLDSSASEKSAKSLPNTRRSYAQTPPSELEDSANGIPENGGNNATTMNTSISSRKELAADRLHAGIVHHHHHHHNLQKQHSDEVTIGDYADYDDNDHHDHSIINSEDNYSPIDNIAFKISDAPSIASTSNNNNNNNNNNKDEVKVKYRNSSVSSTNKKKTKSENNRQSWLSSFSLSNSNSNPKQGLPSISSTVENSRKSFVLSRSIDNDNISIAVPAIDESSDRPNSGAFFDLNSTSTLTAVKSKTKFNPIERGRELFNDILMAKGRHRNRHNQQNHQHHQHRNNNTSIGGGSKGNSSTPSSSFRQEQEQSSLQNITTTTSTATAVIEEFDDNDNKRLTSSPEVSGHLSNPSSIKSSTQDHAQSFITDVPTQLEQTVIQVNDVEQPLTVTDNSPFNKNAHFDRNFQSAEVQQHSFLPSDVAPIFVPVEAAAATANESSYQITTSKIRTRNFGENIEEYYCDGDDHDAGSSAGDLNVCNSVGAEEIESTLLLDTDANQLSRELPADCVEATFDENSFAEESLSVKEVAVENLLNICHLPREKLTSTEDRGRIQELKIEAEAINKRAKEDQDRGKNIGIIADATNSNVCSTNIDEGVVASISPSLHVPSSSDESGDFTELTECDRDRLIESESSSSMGQSYTKQSSSSTTPIISKQTECPQDTLIIEEPNEVNIKSKPSKSPPIVVPTITVVDYSDTTTISSASPTDKDVFYDFESYPRPTNYRGLSLNITTVEEEDEHEDDDEDDIDGEDDEDDEDFREDDAEDDDGSRNNGWQFIDENTKHDAYQHTAHDELDLCQQDVGRRRHGSLLKSENTSDSNLSTSYPDSGIGESAASSKILLIDSCDLLNDRDDTIPPSCSTSRRSPFVRDGYSTDCDESLPQCDDFDFVNDLTSSTVNGSAGGNHFFEVLVSGESDNYNNNDNDRHILIESISLPDVVVESTASTSSSSAGDCRDIVNVNGASGNIMGNVHFIPINIEGGGQRRSVDDSVLNECNHTYKNNQFGYSKSSKPTITVIAEDDDSDEDDSRSPTVEEKSDLVNQESLYTAQLEDAQKNAYNLETKINELQAKIDDLERELSMKSWNVDRLQAELGAAHRDDEFVRKKLKALEEDKTTLRHQYFEKEEDLKGKYEELEQQYKELEEKYKQTQHLASDLQQQVAAAQSEADACRQEMSKLREEMDEQVRILQNSLENSEAERKILEDKWQNEFEMLRTHNADREEHLMADCEWQLRQMQRTCKDKVDKAQHDRQEALAEAERIASDADEKINEVAHLRSYEVEVRSLRGLTSEQETSISMLTDQIEELKADLLSANEKLEEQIECVRKIKYQCDNALYDKERQMIQKIDDVRNEAAALWENKLYTEMTRLKFELESVYVDERRESLDKLQAEHIEELKALTTRYTANEEELRAELEELKEQLSHRNGEFLELREKSDNAILQTRMHLDRADRDYQSAMCREEEKREKLAESLREEFETEKLEMEEKFRDRLGQVKDEFARELQSSTLDMADQHQRQLEQQWEKLMTEKEDAIQDLESRYRKKLDDAENRTRDIELRHQRDLKDLKAMYDSEKASLDKRDLSNANEIEQLHRKCRCLTNLFEEMRMRYERRDPRPEDLREISELRSRCESQERDLYLLTDRLREMQIQMEDLASQQNPESQTQQKKGGSANSKQIKKPPPKTIPTNCDVIYEENEERESPPPTSSASSHESSISPARSSAADEEEEEQQNGFTSSSSLNEKNNNNRNKINEDHHHVSAINKCNQSMMITS